MLIRTPSSPSSPPPALAQQAAAIVATGWWTRNPAAGGKESPDAFEAGRGPDGGPLSVAALRVLLDAPLERAVLRAMESGGFRQGAAALVVCPTRGAWEPANGGAMDDAPEPDCGSASAPFEADDEGLWTAEITSMLGVVGSRSVMVVPDPEADPGPLDPGFSVEFEPATLEARAAPTEATPEPTVGPVTGGGSSSSAPPPTTTTTVPSVPSLLDPVPEPGGPEAVSEAPPQATGTFPVRPAAGLPDAGDPRPWWRLAFLVPLAGAVGFGAAYGRRFLTERGLLGTGV